MPRDRTASACRRTFVGLTIAGALLLAACGGSNDSTAADDAVTTEVPTTDGSETDASGLSGIVREPTPVVDGTSLPSLTVPGEEVDFQAQPGGIEVVYFGFTNCPDVCPTTLSDLGAALKRIERDDPASADLIDTVMVTVDPNRDKEILSAYVSNFVPGAVAAGTDDEAVLEAAGEPFGASWDVRTLDDGTIEVDHTPFLYAVDDAGELVLTWQFGATPSDIASDLEILLDRTSA